MNRNRNSKKIERNAGRGIAMDELERRELFSAAGMASSVDLAGNSLAAARAVGILSAKAVSFRDFVGSLDGDDYYQFSVNAHSSGLAMTLKGLASNADLELLNVNGEVINASRRAARKSDVISMTLDQGVYYAHVVAISGDTAYQLSISAKPPKVADKAGNALKTAFDMGALSSSPSAVNDWVGSTDRDDYYKFDVTQASDLVIQIQSLKADANVELLDAQGNIMGTSTNPGKQDDAVSLTLEPGTYYGHVVGASNTNYVLRVGTSADLSMPVTKFPKAKMTVVAPSEIDFQVVQGHGANDDSDPWPRRMAPSQMYYTREVFWGAARTFTVHNKGDVGSTLEYVVKTSGNPWLRLENGRDSLISEVGGAITLNGMPSLGREVTVVIDTRALLAGTYTGTVNIIPLDGESASVSIPVKVTVLPDTWTGYFKGTFQQVGGFSLQDGPASGPVGGIAHITFQDVKESLYTGFGQGTAMGNTEQFEIVPTKPLSGFSFVLDGGAIRGRATDRVLSFAGDDLFGGAQDIFSGTWEVTQPVDGYTASGTFTFYRDGVQMPLVL